MKKKILLTLACGLLVCCGGCDCFKYEAYVTIVNIGSIDMIGAVEGDEVTIGKFSSATWVIPLDHRDEVVTVHLYAEPLIGGDYDEATATLQGDRDIVTWLAGWDLAEPSGKLQKKKSYFAKK